MERKEELAKLSGAIEESRKNERGNETKRTLLLKEIVIEALMYARRSVPDCCGQELFSILQDHHEIVSLYGKAKDRLKEERKK